MSAEVPELTLTADLVVQCVVRGPISIGGRLRLYVVMEDGELKKVYPNGFRIFARDGATLHSNTDE